MLILLAAFVIAGCKKDDDANEPEYGTVEITRNGEYWEASIWAVKFPADSTKLEITVFKNTGECELCSESVNLHNIPVIPGHYSIIKLAPFHPTENVVAVYGTTVDDGDVGGDYGFPTADSLGNFIEIESYDSITQEISATFNVSIIVNKPKYDETLPDTLRFENARFKVKVRK